MQDRKVRSDQWNPPENIVQEIIKRYEEGTSARQLVFLYSATDVTITALLKRHGVFIRNRSDAKRTNQIKEDIFDTITEESAYWVGFILADGNIYHPKKRSKQLNIGLAERDWEHLEKFKKFIGSNKQLYYNNGGVFISFYSNRIVEKLAEYGIVPRKSKIAKVPENLKNNRHFWRGMVDGDGWVTTRTEGHPILGLCGTLDVVKQFRCFVNKSQRIYRRDEGKNFGELAYTCCLAQILAKRLYEGAEIFLQRKYDGYQRICSWVPQKNPKSIAFVYKIIVDSDLDS